jgi:hypothetical protein
METTDKPGLDLSSLVQLFLVSFLSLFIELVFIRWMSADIRAFSIFKTFPLVACFIGLGVGCAQKNDRWFAWSPLMIFLSVLTMEYLVGDFGFDQLLPANLASYNWVEPLNQTLASWLPITAGFMAFLVVALALPFFTMVCLGTRIGTLFNKNSPLLSYTADILGAVSGTILSSCALIWGLPPSFLFAVAGLLLLLPLVLAKARLLIPLAASLACLFMSYHPPDLGPGVTSIWSPYQHLVLKTVTDDPKRPAAQQRYMFWLFVNGRSYQACWHPDLTGLKQFAGWLVPYWSRCIMPYRFIKPQEVAIVASGMGVDLQAALTGSAGKITAVDIDPFIMGLGKRLNPCHPYQSERVTSVCDDARHFFRSTHAKYDLIVFSHLDSQTVLGQSSSVRLDNFVYTKESFERALKALKKDGLLFVCFNARKDWFRDRLYLTLTEAAGYPPLMFTDAKDPTGWARDASHWSFFALSGPLVSSGKITLPVDLTRINAQDINMHERVLTDDWPFLYVQNMAVDWTYILVCLEILIITVAAGRKCLFHQANPERWQLFFLGAAFLLLELQSISRLSLLYGTTWTTSAVVITGVLLMILIANAVVVFCQKVLSRNLNLLYVFLGAALLASYLLPVDRLLSWDSSFAGNAVVTAITLLPMLIAGLIFPVSLARHKDAATAFAFNLCGATIGALLEYQSNFTGINSLVLLSALLYLFSFLSLKANKTAAQAAQGPDS